MEQEPDNPHKWFTPGEAAIIADTFGFRGIPRTRWGMTKNMKAKRAEGLLLGLYRTRGGREGGGGTEYHWTAFNTDLWDELDAEVSRRERAAGWQQPVWKAPSVYKPPIHRSAWTRARAESQLEPTSPSEAFWITCLLGFSWEPFTYPPVECPVVFRKPVLRTVDRCLIKFRTQRFFSRDLNKYYKRDVIVHSSPAYPGLIWCQEYDASSHRRGIGSGKDLMI